MKKLAVLLLPMLALVFAGCGKRTATFIIDNQSDQFFAWQLSQITDTSDQKISDAINHLAAETIKITDNWKPITTYGKKEGNNLYLFLTN